MIGGYWRCYPGAEPGRGRHLPGWRRLQCTLHYGVQRKSTRLSRYSFWGGGVVDSLLCLQEKVTILLLFMSACCFLFLILHLVGH